MSGFLPLSGVSARPLLKHDMTSETHETSEIKIYSNSPQRAFQLQLARRRRGGENDHNSVGLDLRVYSKVCVHGSFGSRPAVITGRVESLRLCFGSAVVN